MATRTPEAIQFPLSSQPGPLAAAIACSPETDVRQSEKQVVPRSDSSIKNDDGRSGQLPEGSSGQPARG